jgi:hypothetical protein
MAKMFKVEIRHGDGKRTIHPMSFSTRAEACEFGFDLFMRWNKGLPSQWVIISWRVIEVSAGKAATR